MIGSYVRTGGPDRFVFKQARRLPTEETGAAVHFDKRTSELARIDDLATNMMVPIVSPRVQSVLREHAGDDVQLVDVRVIARDGELDGYKIVNATVAVKAIDHDRSTYSLIPGTNAIMGFQKLALLPGSLAGHAVARDADYLSNLMVSDSLADALRALGPNWLGLYRPEDMHW